MDQSDVMHVNVETGQITQPPVYLWGQDTQLPPISGVLEAVVLGFKELYMAIVGALFGQPQAFERPPNPVGCCGPDITVALRQTLRLIALKFGQLGDLEREVACGDFPVSFHGVTFGMYNPRGWDIHQLFDKKDWLSAYQGCATWECGETVEVDGGCYDMGAVNYVMWGLMHDLCHGSAASALAWPTAWKVIRFLELPDPQTTGWIRAGWAGWDRRSAAAPSHAAFRGCRPCGKKDTSAAYQFTWEPFIKG